MEFKGKTFVVSGASMGIGRALAIALAERGANLVLNARGVDALQDVRIACLQYNTQVECVPGSIGDEDVAKTLVRKGTQMGWFSGFFLVAGVLHPGPCLWELEEKQFEDVFESSVRGAYQLIRHAVPMMRGQPGKLAVFFGSGASQIAQPGIAAYCAAKAAEEHMARQLAAEAPDITTIIYQPGIVDTSMQEKARTSKGGGSEALRKVFAKWKDEGELITPEESALALVRGLLNDPAKLHGRTVRPEDM